MATFGDKVKEARLAAGLTQTDVAQAIGVKFSAIAKYESGRVINISEDRVEKLAAVLKVSPEWLTAGTPLEQTDGISPTKRKLIRRIKSMPDEQAEALLLLIQSRDNTAGEK